jgi:hypothetical protein
MHTNQSFPKSIRSPSVPVLDKRILIYSNQKYYRQTFNHTIKVTSKMGIICRACEDMGVGARCRYDQIGLMRETPPKRHAHPFASLNAEEQLILLVQLVRFGFNSCGPF